MQQELAQCLASTRCVVYPKVRVADALRIEASGISNEEYGYCLKAHFDFLVVRDDRALFAVEFDGPSHNGSRQRKRDQMKDSVCARLGMPLLRVDNRTMTAWVDGTNLLQWLVEGWLRQEHLNRAQEKGWLPKDDVFHWTNPHFLNGELVWPDPRARIAQSITKTLGDGSMGSPFLGVDPNTSDSVALIIARVDLQSRRHQLPISSSSPWLIGFGRCRSFNFQAASSEDVAQVLAAHSLDNRLRRFLAGERVCDSGVRVARAFSTFKFRLATVVSTSPLVIKAM